MDEMNYVSIGSSIIIYAKKVETDTKKMAMNRNRRIEAINRSIFNDYTKKKFRNWERCININPNVLCICGQYLESEAFLVSRDNSVEKVCLGSECVKQLDKDYKTALFEDMKKREKKCPHCNKRKNLDEKMCKKCKEYKLCITCKEPNKTSKYLECLDCYNKTIPLKGKCYII